MRIWREPSLIVTGSRAVLAGAGPLSEEDPTSTLAGVIIYLLFSIKPPHTSPAGSGRHQTQLLVVASVGVLKHPARVSCNKVIHQGKSQSVALVFCDLCDLCICDPLPSVHRHAVRAEPGMR